MRSIDPNTLRSEREKKKWSLDDLAKRCGINRQSIHRIESGNSPKNRDNVIERLANALGVSEDILTAAAEASVSEKKMDESDEKFSESQLNLRVSNGSRNALVLTALRYGVSQAQIVELAPFLFFWAAEMSLRARRTKLDAIQKKYDEIDQVSEDVRHVQFRTLHHYNNGEPIEAEDESIEKRDIFGATIGDYGAESHMPHNYEESEDNPMTMFLKELVAEFSDTAEFDGWFPDLSPNYSICKKEVLSIVGGDEEAAAYIHSGKAPLHKLSKELRGNGKEAQRADWAREQGKQWLLDIGL